MGKSSAPATPDYAGATQLQGELNKENLNSQNYANRPTINTPWGTQSWGTQASVDPATGQVVTSWTQNNTLAPGLQSALQDQLNIQSGRSQLANGFMSRVANEYGTAPDYTNLPEMAQAGQPTSLQTGTTDYVPGLSTSFNFGTPQASLNTSDNPALPQFDSSYRDTIANQLMQKMQPTHDYQQRQLDTKLANMGFHVGSEGYDREQKNLAARQAAERYNALDTAGNEAQRLYGMQMGTAQQAFNQDLQGGQFANQAINQGYNQNLGAAQFQNQALNQAQSMDLANMQAGNQAASQQYGLNQQYANAQNQLRQQAIAEMLQRRGTSLNEMNALLNGQQVQMPQMPSFSQSGQAQAPDLMGALQNQYNAQLGAVNAENAGMNGLLGAGASLGAAYLMGPAAGAGRAAFGFSDRRLKSNSLPGKDYIGAAYQITLYFFNNLFLLIRYFIFLKDKLTRKIESFCYYTFFLKKKDELQDEDPKRENKNKNVLEISFAKEKERNLNEYNEAGFFVSVEPNVLMTMSDGLRKRGDILKNFPLEVEKINYDLIKPKMTDENEKGAAHIWFSALLSAVQNYLNNKIDFMLYENPSFEVFYPKRF